LGRARQLGVSRQRWARLPSTRQEAQLQRLLYSLQLTCWRLSFFSPSIFNAFILPDRRSPQIIPAVEHVWHSTKVSVRSTKDVGGSVESDNQEGKSSLQIPQRDRGPANEVVAFLTKTTGAIKTIRTQDVGAGATSSPANPISRVRKAMRTSLLSRNLVPWKSTRTKPRTISFNSDRCWL